LGKHKKKFEGVPSTFGEWLLFWLTKLGKTRKDLAKEVCICQGAIGSWVRDYREPGIRNFLWACRVIALWRDEDEMVVVREASEFFK